MLTLILTLTPGCGHKKTVRSEPVVSPITALKNCQWSGVDWVCTDADFYNVGHGIVELETSYAFCLEDVRHCEETLTISEKGDKLPEWALVLLGALGGIVLTAAGAVWVVLEID